MDKVLVTGGLGRVGSYVCRMLVAGSRQPVVYDAGSSLALIRDHAAECIVERGSVCDLPRLLEVISRYKPVAILHLAGLVDSSVEKFPWTSLNNNLLGTANVFEA